MARTIVQAVNITRAAEYHPRVAHLFEPAASGRSKCGGRAWHSEAWHMNVANAEGPARQRSNRTGPHEWTTRGTIRLASLDGNGGCDGQAYRRRVAVTARTGASSAQRSATLRN